MFSSACASGGGAPAALDEWSPASGRRQTRPEDKDGMRTLREMLAGGLLNAAPHEARQYRACVAIDIGSSYSGYAYVIVSRGRSSQCSLGDDGVSGLRECGYINTTQSSCSTIPATPPSPLSSSPTPTPSPTPICSRSPDAHEVHAVRMMTKPLDSRYPRKLKTATALLLNAEGELVYFGFRARDAYEELRKRHEEGAYSFFENLKLALDTARDVNANTPVAAANGRERPIGHLMKLTIDCLRALAVKELKQQEGLDNLQPAHIRWVLTVPAIWSTAAKRVMRQAAYAAGLSSTDADAGAEDEQQLLVVHEPDACALAVRPLLMRAALEPDF